MVSGVGLGGRGKEGLQRCAWPGDMCKTGREPSRGGGVGTQKGCVCVWKGCEGVTEGQKCCVSVAGPPPSSDATQSVSKSCSCKYCVLPVPFVLSLS